MNNRPFDRDFVQTSEGLYFCIVGYAHPPNRVLAYLKYIPASTGKWKFENQHLQRMLPYYSAQAVINTFQFLKDNYPQYLFHDKFNNMTFSTVPFESIKTYFSTKSKLKEILGLSKLDPLQSKLKSFVTVLSQLSGVPVAAFGITGSILLNIHNPEFSDLDVTIHGYEYALKVKQTMKKILVEGHPDLLPLNSEERKRWQQDKAKRFGMPEAAAAVMFSRKWNMGEYQKTRISLHPIRNLEEIYENYGDKTFVRKGDVEIQGTVSDDSEALFLPAKYKISDVKIKVGKKVENLQEIVSYEGLFDSVAEKDEDIQARGQLELVTDNRTRETYFRLVVGSQTKNSKEYILNYKED
ncbi:MAG: hypothetical protein LUQ65_03745 [Candidatus Helarchaeota archaeon]|nr:hypothetical protein [Candidatus Helarchaeota archaeon]